MSAGYKYPVKTGLNISLILICLMPAVCLNCTVHPRYKRGAEKHSSGPEINKIKRRRSRPVSRGNYIRTGTASYYGPGFHGKQTANGERFNMYKLTAAHKTLPFGTKVKVTNIDNNKKVTVRINDRGPYKKGRIIDLSKAAAEKIGMTGSGTAEVRLEVIK